MIRRLIRRQVRTALPSAVVLSPLWRRRPVMCAVAVGLLVLATLGREGVPSGGDYDRYHGRVFTVVYVADGDTVDVDLPDGEYRKTRIRLWGVDTPEVKGSRDGAVHFGAEASTYAKETLLNTPVRLVLAPERSRDKYNRLLAYVIIEATGQSYNELLIENGLAYADWRFRHPLKAKYKKLERTARKGGTGLWAEITPNEMPAWRSRMERELKYQPP